MVRPRERRAIHDVRVECAASGVHARVLGVCAQRTHQLALRRRVRKVVVVAKAKAQPPVPLQRGTIRQASILFTVLVPALLVTVHAVNRRGTSRRSGGRGGRLS